MTPVVLIVLDGYGIAPPGPGNAVYLARPENLNSYMYAFPNTLLKACGEAVGLPADEVGNTEVGHLNIGAGKIVNQSLPRINLSIADGNFYKNKVFLDGINHVERSGGAIHIIGLVGVGSVHASIDHLYALLFLCKERGVKHVYIHAITDGRDSPPQSARNFLTEIDQKIKQLGVGKIATVMGRYFAMDRDRRWDRVERAYKCLAEGAANTAQSWGQVIEQAYANNVTDEFIEPVNIVEDGKPVALIGSGDAVVFYNYRVDRPRELTKAFALENFERDANKMAYDPYAIKYFKKHEVQQGTVQPPFKRGQKIEDLYFATMTEYEKNLPVNVAFPSYVVKIPLGRVISGSRLAQLRIAESEKERFVTYYFNGERESRYQLEERIIIPSPKVPTYDLKPEMSAFEITDTLIKKMFEKRYMFTLVSFANPDMVGHTGNIQAAVKAISAVDRCIGRIADAAFKTNTTLVITSDHGNCEEMIDPKTGTISTEHSANQVPFIVVSKMFRGRGIRLQTGILADVAPTVLSLMDIDKSPEMTGRDLLAELHQHRQAE